MNHSFQLLTNLLKILCAASIVLLSGVIWYIVTYEPKKLPYDAPQFYCGTMNLPENKILTIEHRGKYIFDENCVTCHSIVKDQLKVGPSVCLTTNKISRNIFELLLNDDPKNTLIKTKYYRKLSHENANMSIHSQLKFNFNKANMDKLVSYIDTITVLQE